MYICTYVYVCMYIDQRFLSVILTDSIKKRETEINYEIWVGRIIEFIKTFNVKISFQNIDEAPLNKIFRYNKIYNQVRVDNN